MNIVPLQSQRRYRVGVLLLGTTVSVSGLILDFPNFEQGRQMMQTANQLRN